MNDMQCVVIINQIYNLKKCFIKIAPVYNSRRQVQVVFDNTFEITGLNN